MGFQGCWRRKVVTGEHIAGQVTLVTQLGELIDSPLAAVLTVGGLQVVCRLQLLRVRAGNWWTEAAESKERGNQRLKEGQQLHQPVPLTTVLLSTLPPKCQAQDNDNKSHLCFHSRILEQWVLVGIIFPLFKAHRKPSPSLSLGRHAILRALRVQVTPVS